MNAPDGPASRVLQNNLAGGGSDCLAVAGIGPRFVVDGDLVLEATVPIHVGDGDTAGEIDGNAIPR